VRSAEHHVQQRPVSRVALQLEQPGVHVFEQIGGLGQELLQQPFHDPVPAVVPANRPVRSCAVNTSSSESTGLTRYRFAPAR